MQLFETMKLEDGCIEKVYHLKELQNRAKS